MIRNFFKTAVTTQIFELSYQEEILKSVNNSIDCENGFPIFSENIETNVSFKIDIWVINLRLALHL